MVLFNSPEQWQAFDKTHIWHPYTSLRDPLPTYPIVRTEGVYLELANGNRLVDAMSSWWSAIHGYNHPALVDAAAKQLNTMPHVMFGGIAHEPAAELCARLIDITPASLDYVFLADSGSIAVEVAMKMALQYWFSQGETQRRFFLSPRGGYHGDTLDAMSVSDPENGLHHMFASVLPKQLFADKPSIAFDEPWQDEALNSIKQQLATHSDQIAAVILEPIVQGVGAMNFYHPTYLQKLRHLCDENSVLLIFDEIATGFGRTGKLFAAEHSNVEPDIMCVGKALTGGMMTLAATLTNHQVADTISNGPIPNFMHGPTFMGNPLACACANASIELLINQDWQSEANRIENKLRLGLSPLSDHDAVKAVRTLGAIGVVEMRHSVDVAKAQAFFVDKGVWIRPFGTLIYVMPPYIISDDQLNQISDAISRYVLQTTC